MDQALARVQQALQAVGHAWLSMPRPDDGRTSELGAIGPISTRRSLQELGGYAQEENPEA